MAGHSTAQSMIIVMRNNRNLLRKSNPFRKKSYFENRGDYDKYANDFTPLKRASSEQLREIRTRIIRHRRKQLFVKVVVILLILSVVAWLGVQMSTLNLATAPNQETILNSKEKEANYQFYLKDGSNWLRNRNYQNAVSQYRKAKQIYPDSFKVNFRLAQALAYQCEYENTGCEESLWLLDSLIVIYPHKLRLYGLKNQCYISLKDSINLNENYQILRGIQSWN